LIVKLKKLLSRRDLLVKHQKALVVSVKEQKDQLDPEMLALFQKQNQATLQLYREQIKALEDQIKKILSQDPSMDRNNKMAQSVVGVGPITAAYMIAYTENFTLFVNARKFASYAGTAPFLHNQSGVRKGTHKVSHLANKKMKSLLGMGSRAAIQFDSEMKLYYQRKIAEGKEKGLVLNNVKNKLIQRVFAAVKRQSPYVQLMTYV
jgi:transposase